MILVLIASNMEQLETMLTELEAVSKEIGMKMNLSKIFFLTDIALIEGSQYGTRTSKWSKAINT